MVAAADPVQSVLDNFGQQRRFNSAWTDARQLIAEGAIGEPRQIQVICRDGQGLLNVGTHLLDMMRYVLR